MRIAVDLRILVVGERWINRGMGRFTQQQLAAVLALDHANDYLVLCDPTADVSLLAPPIRAAENAFVKIPPAWELDPAGGFDSTLRRGEEFQDWLCGLDVGLYHAATPFLLWEPLVPQFDACPVVATLYDLIPLVYPDHYLGAAHDGSYFRALELVKRADRVLAISESAKRDAGLYLGLPSERVDVAYPAADSVFRPWPPELARAVLARWGPVPERFALAVSAFHASKNVRVLLEGYAAVPPRERVHLPLLLGGHFGVAEEALINEIASGLGIVDDLVLVGVVTDEELAALYSCATVVVHPSRYEGFGYPVLEAMSCGAPVITTTSSSLPEVAGDAAILVDPDDVGGLADALRRVASDRDLREQMGERGRRRATEFTTAALGAATLGCYERTMAGGGAGPAPGPTGSDAGSDVRTTARSSARTVVGSEGGRLRIAMWTPLPPLQTGIADYAVELLGQLARHFEIEVFVDDGYLPDLAVLERFRVYHAAAFDRRHAQRPFDVTIYQMGNSKFHWYIFEQLRRHPGIVVFHDLGVSPILYDRGYATGDVEPFLRELAAAEGEAAVDEYTRCSAALVGAERDAYSVDFLRRHPMLRSVTAYAEALVVHTEAAARLLRAQSPGTPVAVVGMGVAAPGPATADRRGQQARRTLGYAPGTLVVSAFGIVHETKRIEECIRALPPVVAAHPDTLLVLVGRTLTSHYAERLVELAHDVGVAGHVRFRGHVSKQAFDQELAACDVVVNLRSPSASHMSAVLMRALGAGKAVVMSDLEDWEAIPDRACLRVPVGAGEIEELARGLVALGADPERRTRLGAAARSWFARYGTLASMAEGYGKVVHDVWMDRAGAGGNGSQEPVAAAEGVVA